MKNDGFKKLWTDTRPIAALALLLTLATGLILPLTGCRGGRPLNTVNTPDDARGQIIGAMFGSPSARLANEFGILRHFFSGDELMGALLSGDIDCAFMESTAAATIVSYTSGVRILADPLLEYDLRFAVARENAELLEAVNTALAALTANGTLRGLRDKYFAARNYAYVPPDVTPRPGSLTLAVPPNVFPYSYWDENGDFSGFDIEIAGAVCDFLGVELNIIEEDVAELVTSVWYGRADLALGWLPGDIRDQVSLSDPYAFSYHSIIVRR